jgi:hypothetical protein
LASLLGHVLVVSQIFRRNRHSAQASEQNRITAQIAITDNAVPMNPAEWMALRTSIMQLGSNSFLLTAVATAEAVLCDGAVRLSTALNVVSKMRTSTTNRQIIAFVFMRAYPPANRFIPAACAACRQSVNPQSTAMPDFGFRPSILPLSQSCPEPLNQLFKVLSNVS